MLPVHRSQVTDCSLVPASLPAEPECVCVGAERGSSGQPRPADRCRSASPVSLRGRRHFGWSAAAPVNSLLRLLLHLQLSPPSGLPRYATWERLWKSNTRPPAHTRAHTGARAHTHTHNLPCLPENIHCHLPDLWNSHWLLYRPVTAASPTEPPAAGRLVSRIPRVETRCGLRDVRGWRAKWRHL